MLISKNYFVVKAVLACSLIALSGCQTTNPYTNESQNAKAMNGSIIGEIGRAHV